MNTVGHIPRMLLAAFLALVLACSTALAADEELNSVRAFLRVLNQPYPTLGEFRTFCWTGVEDNPEDYAGRVLCTGPPTGDPRLDQRCSVRWRSCGTECDGLASLALVLAALLACLWGPERAAGFQVLIVEEPPASYLDAQGRAAGFSVDVVREIQRRVGSSAAIQVQPEGRVLHAAESLPGVAFFSFSRTPEREHRFHWITLLLEKPWVFYCAGRVRDARSLEAIRPLRLGVVRGDVREAWAREQGFLALNAAADPESNLRRLLMDRLDCILTEPATLAYECRRIGCDPAGFSAVPAPVTSQVFLAMSSGTPEAVPHAWSDAARKMKEDGTFLALAQGWSSRLRRDYGILSTPTSQALVFHGVGSPDGVEEDDR